MGASISIKDQNTSGVVTYLSTLSFSVNRISVKELIAQRVSDEVARSKSPSVLVSASEAAHKRGKPDEDPSETENSNTALDVAEQIAIALRSFESNEYFILIDKTQASQLDDVFDINDSTQVSFLKLVALVGG